MQRLRFWFIFLWIFTGFALNIERLDVGSQENIVNLDSFVYVIAGVAVISTVLIPREWEFSTTNIVYFWMVVYFIAKLTLSRNKPLIGGLYTYLTIVEIVLLIGLVVLTHKFLESLQSLENTVANITMADVSYRVKNYEAARSDISQEFTRSRRYKRPLSVVVIKIRPEDIKATVQNFSDDIIRLMMSRYSIGNLIRALDSETRRPDLILNHYNKNRIILLLPETNLEAAQSVSKTVQKIAERELGSKVFVGNATFPDDAITFEDLVTYAENNPDTSSTEGDPSGLNGKSKGSV